MPLDTGISAKSDTRLAKKKPNAWGLFDMYGNVRGVVRRIGTASRTTGTRQSILPPGPRGRNPEWALTVELHDLSAVSSN